MNQFIRKSVLFILFAGLSQGVVFAADKPAKNTPAAAANTAINAGQAAVQQNVEKRGVPVSAPAAAAVVHPAAQAYANAPETVPAVSGGTTPDGGHLWNCPKGYSIMNGANLPFSESNLRCRKDPFLYSLNQCGNCVHTPSSTNPNAGCVRGVSMTCS